MLYAHAFYKYNLMSVIGIKRSSDQQSIGYSLLVNYFVVRLAIILILCIIHFFAPISSL